MLFPLTPNNDDIQTALRTFLLSILPDGDACFDASISGATMTVTGISVGAISVLDAVLGEGVAPGTTVTAFGAGTSGGAGTYTVSPAQSVQATKMSTGVEVYEGQDNLVPESQFPDQVVFTVMRRPRLATNIDTYADALFQGTFSGSTMTITDVEFGELSVGSVLFGVSIIPGTVVTSFGSGAGGAGTYQVAPPQGVAPGVIAAGVQNKMQETEVVFQIDVHGPNSADFAQVISTLFRDAYAVNAFAAINPAISPLYADDPAQRPFINENQQVENRWVIDAHLQANQSLAVPQQFTDVISVIPINIDTLTPINPGGDALDFLPFIPILG